MLQRWRTLILVVGTILFFVPLLVGVAFSNGLWGKPTKSTQTHHGTMYHPQLGRSVNVSYESERVNQAKILDPDHVWSIVLPVSGLGCLLFFAALLSKPPKPQSLRSTPLAFTNPFPDQEPAPPLPDRNNTLVD